MTGIKFSKMHGLGNDFMVIDAITQKFTLTSFSIPQLAHRYLGIGFDQALIIEPSTSADFGCRIINADGGEAEQCGNGLRCVASYIVEKGLSTARNFTIATKGGLHHATLLADHQVQVDMGLPRFEPAQIPFITDQMKNQYEFKLKDSQPLLFNVLSMGNPHAVLQVNSITNFPVDDIGQQIAQHQSFPQSTNVGFMEIIDRQHIRLRTFERGSGETYSCGSNACAAVVAGIMNNTLDKQVKVQLKFGELAIEWPEKTRPVLMTGPAVRIFDGIL
jgi:diaminopimelate epimerase